LVSVLTIAACSATSHPSSQAPPQSSSGTPSASSALVSSPPAVATSPAAGVTHGPCPGTANLGGGSNSGGFPERQGVGDGATLWALFFTDEVTVGQQAKVVWRMTGSGGLSISATGPGGQVLTPTWGPESHTGSSWNRPGDEWGTGWDFPTAGCWTINAKRTTGTGYLVVRVGT
jgi:hypothetical protein